jgi:hypothetical protein
MPDSLLPIPHRAAVMLGAGNYQNRAARANAMFGVRNGMRQNDVARLGPLKTAATGVGIDLLGRFRSGREGF